MKHGELRVWWIPQIPMNPFYVPVQSLVEAKLIIDTLGLYDQFQFENKVKPDYSNVGGLQVFSQTENDWIDWVSCDGENFDFYSMEDLRKDTPKWEED